ncbi:anaerobic ribonucleoside-triphosphate reductase [Acidithiobacillus ferriphilus]|jgi:hypothetical protein|uniref:anaerobic ribonucleoside-triphosphate reductase n=1 Tax=Acidithiobacillus ferriphilus TaxID=1689834 RepID=UPI001C071664|nr:anaerobic ribonucleoside-triphosphate reductase [Acidithiobacillus ferriphilus]MBU2831941.1 hypothetical protein [Acidithiobacillus ferriphilus]MEB8473683.1 anaerobic ribonucleoside-triphosphate reductase [Acidithiobacillus ferriphilus]UEP59976.1 anaerobic ribonucleoside-triphosphate reductase [Acidithiobacillus ferriphilus]
MYPEIANERLIEVELSDSERQPCEVWTRVMGYHRPTSSFNIGKQGEHLERKYFIETKRFDGDGAPSTHYN